MEDKQTEDKISTFAQRLKDKLAGSPEPIHADEVVTELVDSQLDAVSGGAASQHISGHLSVGAQNPSES